MREKSTDNRLKKYYTSTALTFFNILILFTFVNLVIAITYLITDSISNDQYTNPESRASQLESLFNEDGSPVDNGRRSRYQLDWFDYAAYEGTDASYAGEVLEDFYSLGVCAAENIRYSISILGAAYPQYVVVTRAKNRSAAQAPRV